MSVVCGSHESVNSATAVCMEGAWGQLEWVEDEWEVNRSTMFIIASSS